MPIEYTIEFENGKLVISDKAGNYRIYSKERFVNFAVNTIKFLGTIPYRKEYDVSCVQLRQKLNNNRIVSL